MQQTDFNPCKEFGVFISYSHHDSDQLAKQIFDKLEDWKYRPWLDEKCIKNFSRDRGLFDKEILAGLNSSDIFLGIQSYEAAKSTWVGRERAWADELNRPFIVARLHPVSLQEEQLVLIHKQYIDFEHDPHAFDKLRGALDAIARDICNDDVEQKHASEQATKDFKRDIHDRITEGRQPDYSRYFTNESRQSVIETVKQKLSVELDDPFFHRLFGPGILTSEIQSLRRISTSDPSVRPILTSEIQIGESYEKAIQTNQLLLIRGNKGAGKTTELLRLARYLIGKLEQKPGMDNQPFPLFLSLGTWKYPEWTARGERSEMLFENWAKVAAAGEYTISSEVVKKWLDFGAVVLLLDGLDEVLPECRQACLLAISEFYRERSNIHIALTSRIEEYDYLTEKPKVLTEVRLAPLTIDAVEGYLDELGGGFEALREAIHRSSDLQKIAATPLMLRTLVIAYQGIDPKEIEDLLADLTRIDRRLFEAYLDRVFEVDPLLKAGEKTLPDSAYLTPKNRKRILKTLAWMAERLDTLHEPRFFMERMDKRWLPETNGGKQRESYWDRVKAIYIGLIMLPAWLTIGITLGSADRLGIDFVAAPLAGFLLGLGSWESRRRQESDWRLLSALVAILIGLLFVFNGQPLVGLLFGSASGISLFVLLDRMAKGSGAGARKNLMDPETGQYSSNEPEQGSRVEAIGFSWQKSLLFSGVGAIIGYVLGGLVIGSLFNNGNGAALGLAAGAGAGLSGGFFGSELNPEKLAVSRPNLGFWQAVRHAVEVFTFVGGLTAIIGAIIFYIIEGRLWIVENSVLGSVFFGIAVGITMGLQGGFLFGGITIIQQLTLRSMLRAENLAPWDLPELLDAAERRRLLYSSAGGFRFIHDWLRQHIANPQ